MKAGGVAVATMPLLRAKDLASPINTLGPRLALCDARLVEELEKTRGYRSGPRADRHFRRRRRASRR